MLVPRTGCRLLPQRSIHENVALPLVREPSKWLINARTERHRVSNAVKRLQIDTRAESQLRRLSGGNQQKVVIARWIATGFQTLLCFDPTRGIDIGTKHQIYRLLREMADAGSSVLLFTSELPEIALVCDRTIVLFGGEIVAEMPASEADEETLLRAAHGLEVAPAMGAAPRASVRSSGAGATAELADKSPPSAQAPDQSSGLIDKIWDAIVRYPALFGMPVLLIVFLMATVAIHPRFDSFDAQSLAMAALLLACAALLRPWSDLGRNRPIDRSVIAVANVRGADDE